MAEEPNLAAGGLGGSPAEGRAASAMGNSVVNSRLSVDLSMLQGLNKELNTLNENTKKIKSNFKDLIRDTKSLTAELNKAATAMGKVSGKSSAGYMDTSKGMPAAANIAAMRDTQLQSVERILSSLGGGGGGGVRGPAPAPTGGGRIQGGLQAFAGNPYVQMAGQAILAGGQAIDDRVDRNRSYALPADRLSVQLQQQYGMSQQQVMTNLRGPLRGYRLGAGGINELLSMQSRTGLSAQQQAGSVEGIRTLMGYGYSTGDVTNYIESMAQADTVNRMFMMTGTSIYGIGGKQKSAQQVNQELIQRLGLNNRKLIQAGRQSGSVVRQRLQMAGLDEGAQDVLLQYAESNVGFRERGGKGFYDPSSKKDRERMGIEGNYATQAEETERVKVDREEQMYKRQADNYAQMEKNIQLVNRALKAFEDQLSGVIGAKTSVRGFGGLARMGLGLVGGIAGAFMGGPMGAMAGFQIGSSVGGFLGDPSTASGTASPGMIAKENPTTKKSNMKHLAQLKPVLREPLARLMADRPGISIQGGYRSPDTQKQMFLSRYEKTEEKTDTYWDGSYWKKKPGVPMAAPPGLSYHEIGLAADLNFATDADRQWLQQNASKYGLDEFSRHGEPWHVQSKAYPASRKQYEEGGASFGTNTDAATKYEVGTTGITTETGPMGQSGASMSYEAAIQQQMSMSDSIAGFANRRATTLLYGNSAGNSAGAGGGRSGGGAAAGADVSGQGGQTGHGKTQAEQKKHYLKLRNKMGTNTLSASTVSDYLRGVSVRGRKLTQEEVANFTKIVGRESRYDAHAYNSTDSTGDFSFGLLQLNLQGSNKNDALRLFPELKGNFGALWDPKKNIEVAAGWLMADGLGSHRLNNIYHHWAGDVDDPLSGKGGYKHWQKGGKFYTEEGDPFDSGYKPSRQKSSPSAGSGATKVSAVETTNVFNVNPTINITSTGSAPVDASRIAKEVSKLLEREVRMTAVRNS